MDFGNIQKSNAVFGLRIVVGGQQYEDTLVMSSAQYS
jgi:hypothetical protein